MDAISAFLQGDLRGRNIHVSTREIPKVCCLKKSMYGLKQASYVRNIKLDSCLKNICFQQSKFNPCVYMKNENSTVMIIAVWIDDFLIFSNDKLQTNSVKNQLKDNFKMTDIDEVKYVLGFQVTRDRQNKMVVNKHILNRFYSAFIWMNATL